MSRGYASAEPRALSRGRTVFFGGLRGVCFVDTVASIFRASQAICIFFAKASDENSSSSVDKSSRVSVDRKPLTNSELSHQKKAMLYGPLVDSLLMRLLSLSSPFLFGRASRIRRTSLMARPAVATAASGVCAGCSSHNVRTVAASNKTVNDKKTPSTIDGRRLRVCSA